MALYDVSTSEKKANPELVAGGTLWADAPLGSIQIFCTHNLPSGYHECDGSELSKTEYADLYAVIGDAFKGNKTPTTGYFCLPDLRECTLKGASDTNNDTYTIGTHQKIAVGEFLDDRKQANTYSSTNRIATATSEGSSRNLTFNFVASGSQYNGQSMSPTDYIDEGRTGATTEVKSVGAVFGIKISMVAVPADFLAKVQPKTLDTPLTIGGVSQTTVEGALGGLNDISVPRIYYNPDTLYSTEQNRIDAIEYILNNLIDVTTFVRPRKVEAIVRYNGGVYFQYTFNADWESTSTNGCDILEIGAYNKIIGTWMGRRTNETGIWAVEKRGVFLEQSNVSYSTTETKTGGTWIDGKPIYRKVVDLGTLPNTDTEYTVPHGITNISTAVSIEAFIVQSGITEAIPNYLSDAKYIGRARFRNVYVTIITKGDWSAATGYAILEYTKTTD